MLKELNQVIDYIEDHLTDDLPLGSIAGYAAVSDYHFRKVFFFLSGLTLSEYIKNRRLSEANKDLLKGAKVTDVAFKYDYQSMDGFTRAFKMFFYDIKSIHAEFDKAGLIEIMEIIENYPFFFIKCRKSGDGTINH